MGENYVNRSSFMNIRGTTCKSFKIGKTSVSFSSSALEESNKEISLMKYKHLVSLKDEDGTEVIYDMDVPMTAIKFVSQNSDGSIVLHLVNGEELNISSTTQGVQFVPDTEKQVDGSIVIVAVDKQGNTTLKNAGLTILKGKDVETPNISSDSTRDDIIAELRRISSNYESNTKLDSELPTMEAVKKYVGTLESVLDARLNGKI